MSQKLNRSITVTETKTKNGQSYFYKIFHWLGEKKRRISKVEFMLECSRPLNNLNWIRQNIEGAIAFNYPH